MEDKKKSVLYARTSTDKEEQKLSFEQQRLYQDDRFIIERIFDDRATGTSLNKRTGLIELLKYIGISIEFERDDYIFRIDHRTEIEVVICSSTSRLGRNTKDVQRLIDIIHKNHMKLYFIDINSYSDNEQIEILLNIYFTLDQQYSKELSRKVKYGMQRLSKNDNHIFCTGTIKGYNLKGGKLTKNEDSEKILNIFEEYANNKSSIRKLALKYKWNESTIASILRNKKYAGYNKTTDKEMNPNIQPIISLEVFNKAQEIRASRRDAQGIRGVKNSTYGLSGKLQCPLCGYNMAYRKHKNKKYGMWACYTNRARRNAECSNPSISENRINKYLQKMITTDLWKNEIEFKISLQREHMHNIDIETLNLNKIDLEERKNKLLDLYLDNSIDKSTFEERTSKINIELEKNEEAFSKALNVNEAIKKLDKLEKNYKLKLNEIESLIKDEKWEEIHYKINKVKLMKVQNILTWKDRITVEYVTFNEIDVIEGFIILDGMY